MTAELLPGGPAVTAPHVGGHGTVGFTYETLQEWLAGQQLPAAGDPWESYPDGGSGQTLVTVPCRPRSVHARPMHIRP